jgi:hypothetical protein
MNTVTSVHLRGAPSVHITTQDQEHFLPGQRTASWVGFDAAGTEVYIHGQPGKLLAFFRAIETSLLECEPDAEISFEDADAESEF